MVVYILKLNLINCLAKRGYTKQLIDKMNKFNTLNILFSRVHDVYFKQLQFRINVKCVINSNYTDR